MTRHLPNFATLHERHRGLSPALGAAYAEAADVCLSRHHEPPVGVKVVAAEEVICTCEWSIPSERAQAAWNNDDDATRDAAYAVGLAALELTTERVAIARAETRTGADYYVNTPDRDRDLETAQRLEVSGSDSGSDADLQKRLKKKLRQLKNGRSALPGTACVVGFKACRVLLRDLEDSDAP